MMKTRKLSIILIAAVLLVALAFAGAVSADPNSGKSGGIDWVLSDGNTKLTITLATNPETGYTAGQMKDFDNEAGAPPWADSRYVITSVDLPDGLQNIGDHAFYEFSSLTTITIPESVTKISDAAFAYSGLTSIEIPANVTEIGRVISGVEGAFSSCTDLTEVTFAEGSKLKTIGGCTFWEDTALTSITLPASLETIGFSAFAGCTDMAEVTFAEGSKLKTIGNHAFLYCTSLTSIEIPVGVTSIGEGAFRMSGLESIAIPAGVTSIGEYAFAGNDISGYEAWSALTTITFAEGSKLKTIGEKAFAYSSLESIEIPANVETIGENAFEQCPDLTEVTFADVSKLKTIGNWIFSFDANLKKVLIPKETFSQGAAFGDALFLGCTNFNAVISDKLQAPEVMGKFVASPAKIAANQVAAKAGVIKPVWYISEIQTEPLSGGYDDYFIGLLNGGTLNADFEQQKDGETFTLPIADDVTRTGYIFDKWIDDAGKEVMTLTETTKHAILQWNPIYNRGHSPSLPKEYTTPSYVPPMVQETVEPTATTTPTPAAPTMMPTTKPTATTSKSPAPLAGLVLGLGAAALLMRMRR